MHPFGKNEPAPTIGKVYVNMIGDLPTLTNMEHMALVNGMQQVGQLEAPTPSVATQCIFTLARLAGVVIYDRDGTPLTPEMHPEINPAIPHPEESHAIAHLPSDPTS